MADDDFEDLELVEDAIKRIDANAAMHKVSNGKAAIEFLSKQPDDKLPCLIILDYNMPELTGSQVLSTICKEDRYSDIPKVILSTSSTSLHIQECLSNGATDYLVKPNNMKDMDILAKKMLSFCKEN